MSNEFEVISKVMAYRRTVKTDHMNGKIIPEEWIQEIVAMADFAPTHGRTEPLRLNIYQGDRLKEFCESHAELYWNHTAEEKRTELKYDKLKQNADNASHLVLAMMKRSQDSKIPEKEEYASCCASVQNMLLAAEALGVSSIWSTGGMAYTESMKSYLKLEAQDQVVGLIYLGFSDLEPKKTTRKIPLTEKINWYK